jgi:hypothetical protein
MKELFIVHIGGPLSMETTIISVPLHTPLEAIPAVLKNTRYISGSVFHLKSPDRIVAVYAFADACNAVRQEIFRMAAFVAGLIQSTGDVAVAMWRVMESELTFHQSTDDNLGESLMATVAKQYRHSKLQQRLLIKKVLK